MWRFFRRLIGSSVCPSIQPPASQTDERNEESAASGDEDHENMEICVVEADDKMAKDESALATSVEIERTCASVTSASPGTGKRGSFLFLYSLLWLLFCCCLDSSKSEFMLSVKIIEETD